jgi:hypothetical protein
VLLDGESIARLPTKRVAPPLGRTSKGPPSEVVDAELVQNVFGLTCRAAAGGHPPPEAARDPH